MTGRLRDPGAWGASGLPPVVLDGLAMWVSGQGFDLSHPRWLGRGAAAATALAVLSEVHQSDRTVVVRLMPAAHARAEYHGLELAHQHSPEQFRRHLVNIIHIGQLGDSGWDVHIQQPGHVDGAQLTTLDDLIGDPDFAEHVRRVSHGVVAGWHRMPPAERTQVTPSGYLAGALADRLMPDGALRQFAARAGLDVDCPATTVVIPGRGEVPNPLALVRGQVGDAVAPVRMFAGTGHGELDVGLVLIPKADRVLADDFGLLGLAGFGTEIPLARDPVTLLLSIAQRSLPALTDASPDRSNLAELAVAPFAFSAAPTLDGFRSIARRVHTAGQEWAAEHRVAGDWLPHTHLVLVESALRAIGRPGQSLEDEWWLLEVAAVATRCLLDPSVANPASREVVDPPAQRRPIRGRRTDFPVERQLDFIRRLGDNWIELCILFEVEFYESEQWPRGRESMYLWRWLVHRARLHELPGRLREIGRDDLGDMLDQDNPARV